MYNVSNCYFVICHRFRMTFRGDIWPWYALLAKVKFGTCKYFTLKTSNAIQIEQKSQMTAHVGTTKLKVIANHSSCNRTYCHN